MPSAPPPLILPIILPPPIPSTAQPPLPHHHHPLSPRFLPPAAACGGALSIILALLLFFCRKISRSRTAPADSKPPHRFSYSTLRRATSSFSASRRLGQGGFGSVYRGTLPSGQQIAVKSMDSGSLQGEREFQNELFVAGKIDSEYIVSVLGFASKRQHMMLVYEYMCNGSLQDALLHHKCIHLKDWKKRFGIAVDVAKGIEYLHNCDPPIIHGDIKPSNILLDENFKAKIGDFGLSRVKSEDTVVVVVEGVGAAKMNGGSEGKKKELESNGGGRVEDNGSVIEETESVATTTGFEEFSVGVDQSPDSFVRVTRVEASPERGEAVVAVSPETNVGAASVESLEKMSASEGNFDRVTVESGKEIVGGGARRSGKGKRSVSGKDWWLRQDNGAAETGVVKDYVMEWIGTEIKKERPKSDWIGASSSSKTILKPERKKNRRRLEWWVSLDEEKNPKKEKRRPAREWWKEEYCEELTRKKKKKKKKQQKGMNDDNGEDNWWPRDEELYVDRKKKSRSRSRSSRGSIDWWLDGLSGELWRGRRNSHDSPASGEIPKSGGISSTPSMRGTVCYIAPEYGGGGDLSEKCDVYSYGVLLLVLIAGRRPLQVTGSPMSEFQRANLISWARHLARTGKLLDLVDKSIQSVDQEQALLGIMVALLCLQKSPVRRPSMKEVVGMLSGESDPPQLPSEFSPSPPSRFPFKSQKKVREQTYNPDCFPLEHVQI